jgi:hypothetical protein
MAKGPALILHEENDMQKTFAYLWPDGFTGLLYTIADSRNMQSSLCCLFQLSSNKNKFEEVCCSSSG